MTRQVVTSCPLPRPISGRRVREACKGIAHRSVNRTLERNDEVDRLAQWRPTPDAELRLLAVLADGHVDFPVVSEKAHGVPDLALSAERRKFVRRPVIGRKIVGHRRVHAAQDADTADTRLLPQLPQGGSLRILSRIDSALR